MLANEVHDAVAQTLYFVKMRLPLLHDAMLPHDDARALRYHADLRQAVSEAHASLREILTHFRTPHGSARACCTRCRRCRRASAIAPASNW